ncbi:MAG: condensation domain-containing protein, partial [Methylocystis sp.]
MLSHKPLTSAQGAIYVAHLLDPLKNVYNIAHYRELNGPVSADFLSKALNRVLLKSPAYRSLIKIENDIPVIETRQKFLGGLSIVDFSSDPDPEGNALKWMDQERRRPFNLFEGPLYRWVLIKLSMVRYYVFTCAHHIIVDGSGLVQFERNVFEVYAACVQEKSIESAEGPDLALEAEQLYLASEQYLEDQRFWKSELADLEPQVSLSGKSTANTRAFYRARGVLSSNRIVKLNDFCKRNKIALQRTLIALSALYYARMSNQTDFIVEIPVSLRKTSEDLAAIDMRSSTVFLKITTTPTTDLGEFLKIFQNKFRLALRHQRYPREHILREWGSISNLACFAVNILPDLNLKTISDIDIEASISISDIVFRL